MTHTIIHYPALPSVSTVIPNRRIDLVVMHATAGVKGGDLWTLTGRDKRHRVSCHAYIDKQGGIYELVDDQHMAWHAGVSAWAGESDVNRFSLGYELENLNTGKDPYPQAQLDAVVWYVRGKVQQYKIPRSRLIRHADCALPPGRKSDPRGFPWTWFVDAVYAPAIVPATTAPTVFRVKWRTEGRTAPERGENVFEMVPAGALVPGTLVKGQAIRGNNLWIHRADERLFVWSGAAEAVTAALP
jgi:N-acetyl-anhydromuramyl-L-alanine amidase AmpD